MGAELGERVASLLRSAAEAGTAVVLTHRNADPDAVASALLAWRSLVSLGARACIGLPEGLSRASKQVLAAANVSLPLCEASEGVAAIVVVDASNSSQLGDLARLLSSGNVYLVDHHSPGDLVGMASESVVARVPSTTQLLVAGLASLGYRASPAEATVGLAGIVYDTKRFQLADACSFRAAAMLIEWGGSYEVVLGALQARREPGEGMEYSERVARLKAAQRVELARICEELIIAVTRISAFESSAARALLELGADIAVVVGGRGSQLRVVVRLSRRALNAGLKADELASYIASRSGGSGGGHAAAGMAHVPSPPGGAEELVSTIVKSLPGKAARLCVERRKGRDGRTPSEGVRGPQGG